MRHAALAVLLVVACTSGPPRVHSGKVEYEGELSDGVQAFRGIRFAEPPLGALRWAPPQPAVESEGTVRAVTFAPAPPQLVDVEENASTLPQSEDCLFLNVWTPDPSGRRPVFVFVHGGGWVNGGTNDPWYEGAHLARRGDLVVVTITYRLGALGFMDLSEVGGHDFAQSGNLGLLDQRLALQWLRDHIADFGGDPGNVTFAGQSAGAMSVSTHLALPESRALFHKAIAESGAANLLRPQAYARRTTQRFLELTGARDIASLRALPLEQVLAAEKALEDETQFSDMLYGPVLDGALITEPPLHAIARGDARHLPLLTGSTLDEARYWLYYFPYLESLDPRTGARFLPMVGDLFDDAGREALIQGYEQRYPDLTPGQRTLAMATDVIFRQPAIRLAEAHGQAWMYLFDWQTTVDDGRYGAPHAVELPFLLRTFGEPSVDDFVGSQPPLALSDAMIEAWSAFAHTGVPSSAQLPSWPAYDAAHRSTLRLEAVSRVEDDPLSGDRAAWEGVPFDSLRPSL